MVAIIYLSEDSMVFTSFPKLSVFFFLQVPLSVFVSFRLECFLKPLLVLGWLFVFYDWAITKPMGSPCRSCPVGAAGLLVSLGASGPPGLLWQSATDSVPWKNRRSFSHGCEGQMSEIRAVSWDGIKVDKVKAFAEPHSLQKLQGKIYSLPFSSFWRLPEFLDLACLQPLSLFTLPPPLCMWNLPLPASYEDPRDGLGPTQIIQDDRPTSRSST